MKITITSFSYKRGLPEDMTGNENAPAPSEARSFRSAKVARAREDSYSTAGQCRIRTGTKRCVGIPAATSLSATSSTATKSDIRLRITIRKVENG